MKNSIHNKQPITIYENETKIKKEPIIEVGAFRLSASQPLYQHQFQYRDISDHMFPTSNCSPLTPPPLKVSKTYTVTSCK